MENTQDMQYGKMCPERSVQTKVKILGEFSKRSQKPKFQCLQVESGQEPEWYELNGVTLLGELLMPSIGEQPSVAVESILSQILEANAPEKYYLSPKACQGILRRAEKRGKELPILLKLALEAQAEDKLLVTSAQVFKSAGFISRAPAEAYSIGYEEEKSATLRSGLLPDVLQAEILDMTHANDVIRECGDTCPTLQARMGTGGNQIPLVLQPEVYGICSQNSNSMKSSNPHSGIYKAESSRTLDCNGGNPTCNQGGMVVVEPTYCIQGNTIERSDTAGAEGKGVIEGQSYTLNTVDRHAVCCSIGFCPDNSETAAGLSEVAEGTPTLSTTKKVAACYPINTQIITRCNKLGEGTGFGLGDDGEPSYTLQEAHSHGVIYAIERSAFNQSENAKNIDFCYQKTVGTLCARDYKGVSSQYVNEDKLVCEPKDFEQLYVWIVRRLTPLECERLQGFEDHWTMYDTNGNELKDTPRYKALGNSIAIPCALRVFRGIIENESEENI